MAENNCSQTLAGIAHDCAPSMGGVRRILVANYADIATRTVSTEKVTAITMQTGKKFSEYRFKPDVAYMKHTLTKNLQNGTTFVLTEVMMQFARMSTDKRAEMTALALNDLVMIVEDRNGAYWYLGYEEPVLATGGESGTGTARADANAYGITFQDNQSGYPYEVDGSIVEALLKAGA